MSKWILCIAFAIAAIGTGGAQTPETQPGARLERHSWVEAEKLLRPDTVVVIPLGAALKEHGPHLKLRNDLTIAEYLADRVAASAPVVVTPPLTYHFYPAFLEYPGSTSLTLDTARDYTVQVARSLARYGPKSTERGRRMITQNRIEQFRAREYRVARHALAFGNIRCVSASVAVVDSRWELRDVTDAAGQTLPRAEGFSTLVLQRGSDSWLIEAYRATTRSRGRRRPRRF